MVYPNQNKEIKILLNLYRYFLGKIRFKRFSDGFSRLEYKNSNKKESRRN